MKQTAVEWLVDQLIEQGYFNKDIPKTFTNIDHLTHQAKAMEKEQIKDAHYKGRLKGFDEGCKYTAEN